DPGDRQYRHLHARHELAAQHPREDDPDRRDERPRVLAPKNSDKGDEGGRDDDEIEQYEREEVRPPLCARELISDRTERPALFPDGQHHRAVVLQPADEEVPADNPNQRGKPSELDPDERPEDRTEGRDAFELVSPKD